MAATPAQKVFALKTAELGLIEKVARGLMPGGEDYLEEARRLGARANSVSGNRATLFGGRKGPAPTAPVPTGTSGKRLGG